MEKGKLSQDFDKTDFFTWLGHLKGIKGSSVTITCSQQKKKEYTLYLVNGTIRTPDEVYKIRPAPDWVGEEMNIKKTPVLHIVTLLGEDPFPPDRVVFPQKKQEIPQKKKVAVHGVKLTLVSARSSTQTNICVGFCNDVPSTCSQWRRRGWP